MQLLSSELFGIEFKILEEISETKLRIFCILMLHCRQYKNSLVSYRKQNWKSANREAVNTEAALKPVASQCRSSPEIRLFFIDASFNNYFRFS